MRYLTIAPDYIASCIRDDFEGTINDLESLVLPQAFIEELETWHLLYKKVIPLSEEQRKERIENIEELDRQGLRLAAALKILVSGGAKVRYFSEGKLKYLCT